VAIAERAIQEGAPMILEGVHLVPGTLGGGAWDGCALVEAVVAIEDEDAHRSHFSTRGSGRPADRYLRRFDQIRKLQGLLVERARARGVPVIDATNLDAAVAEAMDIVRAKVSAELSSP
jgi:2-phosphoglycerate kinase